MGPHPFSTQPEHATKPYLNIYGKRAIDRIRYCFVGEYKVNFAIGKWLGNTIGIEANYGNYVFNEDQGRWKDRANAIVMHRLPGRTGCGRGRADSPVQVPQAWRTGSSFSRGVC